MILLIKHYFHSSLSIPKFTYSNKVYLAMSKPLPSPIDEAIGKRIQIRRKELNLSADALSECIDVSQQQFSRYERGASKLSASQIVNISYVTATPQGWFYLDTKPDRPIHRIAELDTYYQSFISNEMLARIQQVWPTLNMDQQKAVTTVVDTFKTT